MSLDLRGPTRTARDHLHWSSPSLRRAPVRRWRSPAPPYRPVGHGHSCAGGEDDLLAGNHHRDADRVEHSRANRDCSLFGALVRNDVKFVASRTRRAGLESRRGEGTTQLVGRLIGGLGVLPDRTTRTRTRRSGSRSDRASRQQSSGSRIWNAAALDAVAPTGGGNPTCRTGTSTCDGEEPRCAHPTLQRRPCAGVFAMVMAGFPPERLIRRTVRCCGGGRDAHTRHRRLNRRRGTDVRPRWRLSPPLGAIGPGRQPDASAPPARRDG